MPREYIRRQQRPDQREAPVEGRLRRKSFTSSSAFDIDPAIIPDGMSYEWKRKTVVGKVDHQHQVNMAANHWQEVPASRHPELMPTGYDGSVVNEDMVLMERPAYLTDEAHAEYFHDAQIQKTVQAKQIGVETPEGHAPRQGDNIPKMTRISSHQSVDIDE